MDKSPVISQGVTELRQPKTFNGESQRACVGEKSVCVVGIFSFPELNCGYIVSFFQPQPRSVTQ
jgi:hypothetical protein